MSKVRFIHLKFEKISNLNLDNVSRSNDLWKNFYFRQHSHPSTDFICYGERRGWRRIFFTSRIKLKNGIETRRNLIRKNLQNFFIEKQRKI